MFRSSRHSVIRFSISWVIVLCFFTSVAHAAPVFLHEDDNDPTTESWVEVVGGSGTSTAGAINDGGTLAWFVDDPSTALSSSLFYQQDVSDTLISEAAANGWRLTATLRVPIACSWFRMAWIGAREPHCGEGTDRTAR